LNIITANKLLEEEVSSKQRITTLRGKQAEIMSKQNLQRDILSEEELLVPQLSAKLREAEDEQGKEIPEGLKNVCSEVREFKYIPI
jgi:hypothetical protein